MNELIKVGASVISGAAVQTVSARDLYIGLGLVRAEWSRWALRNIESDKFFRESVDWVGFVVNTNGNDTRDYSITIEFAKHLVMMARTSNAHEYRNYLLECERRALAVPAIQTPKSFAAALRLAAEQQEVIEAQALKISADAPKVAFAEVIRSIDGVCHVEKVAKTLNYGRNKFFKMLRDGAILMQNNLPYQKYIDKEYFTVVEQEPFTDSKGVKHPTFTAMVTGAGQVFLARKFSSAGAA